MAKKKSNKITSVFKIFFSSIKTYFLYLDQTSKRLAFPIFGQLISLILICIITYFLSTQYNEIKSSCPFFYSDTNILTVYLCLIVPLIIIFAKAFYEYIINFASLNLLFYTTSNKKNIKKIDFDSNDAVIKRKLFNYIILMFLVNLMFIPPLIFVSPIIGIFLCLTFQIFALEGNITPIKAIQRSIELVKSNFIPAVILLLLCFLITYTYLPALLIWICEKISVYDFLFNNCEKFINIIPINEYINGLNTTYEVKVLINDMLSPLVLTRYTVEGLINFLIIGFTLPFRCCCFTEFYRLIDSDKIKDFSKNTDEIIKRASKKPRKN